MGIIKSEMDVEDTSLPGKQLVSTSQGNAYDKPPEQWIPDELKNYGVTGTPTTGPPDIEGPIHTFFSAKSWPQLHHNTRRLRALRPSLILATKLLRVSGPFIASFLPERKYDEDTGKVELRPVVGVENIALALKDLDDIAYQTRVREDESMWPTLGRHGIVLPTGSGIKPDEPARDGIDAECWEKTTERDRDAGLRFRRLTIYLANQFGDTLESLVDESPESERYIQASFMCAVTLVHEIAHVINAAKFEHCTWLGEPRIRGDSLMELGTSLIGWLFDGWIPENISLNSETRDNFSFKNGCCWHKQLREPRGYPQYHTLHSMPMAHIKLIFSEAEWDRFDENHSRFSTQVRKELLRPQVPFRAGQTARIAWKRQGNRVDLSPALDQYYGIWDYHDPDWLGPEARQGTVLTNTPSDPFLGQNVSASPTKTIMEKKLENLGPVPLSPTQVSGEALAIVKANSMVGHPDKTSYGEQEQRFQDKTSPSKEQSEGMVTLVPPRLSPHKPNHSVKRSPMPQQLSKQQKLPAVGQSTRRSRRLLGQPAEHGEGLPDQRRKRAKK